MTIVTNSKQGLPQPGLDAAREGRSFCKFVNAKTSVNSATVLSDSTFILNMELNTRYVITNLYAHLGTVSDTAEFELGVTDGPSGTGTFTAKTVKFQLETGAAAQGAQPIAYFDPPLCLSQADGACFTARVLANDAGAELTLGYNGWKEDA